MNGFIALVGSGEYLETMEAVDRRLLTQARKASPAKVVCIPAAAGEEGDARVERWMRMGVEHFTRLGAHAQGVRIVDRASADDRQGAALIEAADLIYFSGGNPLYLYQTMTGTRAWAAVETAWRRGATYAGCSGGAMILGAYVPDVRSPDRKVYPAFNWVAHAFILPHFDRLESFRPGVTAATRSPWPRGSLYSGSMRTPPWSDGWTRNGKCWAPAESRCSLNKLCESIPLGSGSFLEGPLMASSRSPNDECRSNI